MNELLPIEQDVMAPYKAKMGAPYTNYPALAAEADKYSASQFMPYIQKALSMQDMTQMPVSLAPGLAQMMTEPIYENDAMAGLGGIDTRQAYQDRNATVGTGINLMKERNQELMYPTTMAKTLAEMMQKTTEAGKTVAETAKVRSEIDPAHQGLMELQKSFGKTGGEYGAQVAHAYSTPGANNPLPPDVQRATGARTVGDLVAIYGKSSSDILGRWIQGEATKGAAGITAGGMKESAKIQAVGGILKEQQQLVSGELKRLTGMRKDLWLDAQMGKGGKDQIAAIDAAITAKQGELTNINNNLNSILGQAGGKLGYNVNSSGAGKTTGGYTVGDSFKGYKITGVTKDGKPYTTVTEGGKQVNRYIPTN